MLVAPNTVLPRHAAGGACVGVSGEGCVGYKIKIVCVLLEFASCFHTLKLGWLVFGRVTLTSLCVFVCRTHHPTRSEPASKASMFNLSRKEGEGVRS